MARFSRASTFALMALGSGLFATSALAQDPIVLKYSVVFPPNGAQGAGTFKNMYRKWRQNVQGYKMRACELCIERFRDESNMPSFASASCLALLKATT